MINNSALKVYNCLKSNPKELSKKIGTHVVYGMVTSIKYEKVTEDLEDITELTITVEGRLPLDLQFLELSPQCYNMYAENAVFNLDENDKWFSENSEPFSTTLYGGEPIHSHTVNPHRHRIIPPRRIDFPKIKILLWRGLRVGDKVSMLSCANKQKYVVIGRQDMHLIKEEGS